MKKILLRFAILLFAQSGFSQTTQPSAAVRFEEMRGEVFQLDLRYNTTNNFLKKNVYADFKIDRCYGHPHLAVALRKIIPDLKAQKLKLVFFDCYRPLAVQEAMWKIVPNASYVANPQKGSNHNRGIAIDVTLANAEGKLLAMPTDFDDFSVKASIAFQCPPAEKEKCQNREILMGLMKKAGLHPNPAEWWHYQLPNSKQYPVIKTLEEVK